MDSIDSQLDLVANTQFEEKVDIETLVFPSKEKEFYNDEKEILENAKPVNKERNSDSLESIHDGKKHFKLESNLKIKPFSFKICDKKSMK